MPDERIFASSIISLLIPAESANQVLPSLGSNRATFLADLDELDDLPHLTELANQGHEIGLRLTLRDLGQGGVASAEDIEALMPHLESAAQLLRELGAEYPVLYFDLEFKRNSIAAMADAFRVFAGNSNIELLRLELLEIFPVVVPYKVSYERYKTNGLAQSLIVDQTRQAATVAAIDPGGVGVFEIDSCRSEAGWWLFAPGSTNEVLDLVDGFGLFSIETQTVGMVAGQLFE